MMVLTIIDHLHLIHIYVWKTYPVFQSIHSVSSLCSCNIQLNISSLQKLGVKKKHLAILAVKLIEMQVQTETYLRGIDQGVRMCRVMQVKICSRVNVPGI